MFFIKLYNFIFGYVIVKITGAKPEKFVNALMNLHIKFWGIQRISGENAGDGGLKLKISSRYAKREIFEKISGKTNTECKIISRKGLRFFLERRKYRLGIYTGIIIGAALIYLSTFFIWEVKITKSDYPNGGEVIEILEKLGCKNGALIKNLNIIELQNRVILASNGKISWVAVNIKGTVANVEIKKTEPSTSVTDRKTPANIIASKAGKIIYIDTYEGQQIAEKESAVQKGDLLISGAVNSDAVGMRIKHASGKVLAETARIIEIKIPLVLTEKYYTGTVINRNSLNIFGKILNLYIRKGISIEKYDKIKNTENITLFGAVVLPIKISTAVYSEFVYKNTKIDENTAKDIAISKINCIIDSRFGGDENIIEIKSKTYEGEIKDDYFYMICTVECIENIAEEMPFDTNLKTET